MDQQHLTTILIIDDHPLFRKGVRNLLSMNKDLAIIGEATSGAQGIEQAKALSPNLILLDIDMKGINGIETLKQLRQSGIESTILMLTVSDSEENVVNALRLGADGYLLKDMEPEDILDKINLASRGQTVISDRLTGLLAKSIREDSYSPPNTSNEANLTNREIDILKLVMTGKTNKVVARELGISDGTVKVHMKHILKKLELNTRVEAAVWAIDKFSEE